MTKQATRAYRDKMAARFATFDIDRSGYVTVEDFEGMAHRILDEFQQPETSAKGRDLIDGARAFFDGLAGLADTDTDTDTDGGISETEFVTAAETKLLNNPQGFAEVARPFATAVIAVADTSGDGVVDLDEWSRMLLTMGATEEGAATWPAELDRDGDGHLTVDELLDAAVEFYATDEPHDQFGEA